MAQQGLPPRRVLGTRARVRVEGEPIQRCTPGLVVGEGVRLERCQPLPPLRPRWRGLARDRRGGEVAFRIGVVLFQAEQAAPAEVPLHDAGAGLRQ